ncbi:MAG: crosslink repair DNA glycosylase YcaQ family protein [Candidatus Tectomicrobia bacterium]
MQVSISTAQARRLLLYLQGLCEAPNRRLTPDGLYDLITRLGFVQVDSIRTVERAHHLTLLARNTRYHPDLLRILVEEDRRLFENWTHDASIIPTQWYPQWQPRFARERQRLRDRTSWQQRLGSDAQRVVDQVRDTVQQKGPVMSRDFSDERSPGTATWWGWGPSKTALEYLWRSGELAVCQRLNFQKVYDLTQRVIPAQYLDSGPDHCAWIDWACSTALERLGIATPAEIAAFWGAICLDEARAWCQARVGQAIRSVLVQPEDASKPWMAYARHDIEALVNSLPAAPARIRFLCPFDPVIRDRRRTERLFNFSYRFEAFVPEKQRQYGYYVFPMLQGDRLIGRINLKYERRERTLRVKGQWLEDGVELTKTRQRRITQELARYGKFIGAESIAYE